MPDEEIVALFLAGDESALRECREKYGGYLSKIAYNILGDISDSEEAVADALLGAWRSIPGISPDDLRAYLIKLVRRSAIDILRTKNREKRRAGEYSVSLDELSEVIPGEGSPAEQAELKAVAGAINAWLRELSDDKRRIFIRRYFYAEPIKDIAGDLGVRETKIKSILFRLRKSLHTYLEKEELL